MTSSEQARADALADAAVVWIASTRRPWLRMHLRQARYYGDLARGYASDRDPTISVDPADVAYFATVVSARAAFRAVPGLRGE